MKNLLIFGSTGSIGSSTLKLLEAFRHKYRILGLSARRQLEKLRHQAESFKVPYLVVEDEESATSLKKHLSYKAEILVGDEGLKSLASLPEADTLVVGITGIKGLIPTYYGLKAGKRVALANKESLVCAGDLLKKLAQASKGELLPVDSEHSSLFQLLGCDRRSHIRKLILTASGGPFWHWPLEDFERITPELALKHPTWQMGKRITINSATLMNKGFEVIEAHQLFDFPLSAIEVLIHPQSIVHGLLEMKDGTLLAHMGRADMQIAIAYALSYPERWELPLEPLKLSQIGTLTFHEVDLQKFPCLKLAYEASYQGFPYPLILEAADEVLVSAFLEGKISFLEIPRFLEKTLNEFKFTIRPALDLEDYLALHREAKDFTERLLKREKG